IGEEIADALGAVAGGLEDAHGELADGEDVVVGDAAHLAVDAAGVVDDGERAGSLGQGLAGGDVVGVKVRLEAVDEAEIEGGEAGEVALELLAHGIDEDGGAG